MSVSPIPVRVTNPPRRARGRSSKVQELIEAIRATLDSSDEWQCIPVAPEEKDRVYRRLIYAARTAGLTVRTFYVPDDDDPNLPRGLYFRGVVDGSR